MIKKISLVSILSGVVFLACVMRITYVYVSYDIHLNSNSIIGYLNDNDKSLSCDVSYSITKGDLNILRGSQRICDDFENMIMNNKALRSLGLNYREAISKDMVFDLWFLSIVAVINFYILLNTAKLNSSRNRSN